MMYIEELAFNSVEELLNHVVPWGSNPELDGYIFRGHSQESYLLVPLALRSDKLDLLCNAAGFTINDKREMNLFDQVQAEYQILRRFYRLADQRGLPVPISTRIREDLASKSSSIMNFKAKHTDTWIPPDLHEAAALAQHYGMPTRLLDWTYDIFVAMHFAFKGAIKKEDNLCIWALNMAHLSWLTPTVEAVGVDFVTPHYAGNPHLNAQKGLFTHMPSFFPHTVQIHHDVNNVEKITGPIDRAPFDETLRGRFANIEENIFKKFILPCSEAKKGLQILDNLGYDESRIYPGYKGVANQLLHPN